MKLKYLSTAVILATLPATGAFAAALDRSGQSMAAFFQPGNYFEAGVSVLDPTVSGTTIAPLGSQKTGDMASDYYFPNAALKLQPTENFSVGLIYDQPFGADAEFRTATAAYTNVAGDGSTTAAEVETHNLSLVLGYQPNKNINVYAGAAYQTIEGSVQLRGAAFGGVNGFGGYNASIPKDSAMGWLAGAAYQIPEIALRASVTYRSEIKHKVVIDESSIGSAGPVVTALNNPALAGNNTNITTPQSVNLDLQSGIMAGTVAFANIRWVNWKDFSIRPHKFDVASNIPQPATKGFNLLDYTDDQWSVTAGVGRKLSEQWAGNVSVGWDSGAGNPVTTFGPTEGYWNVGLGAQYSPTPATFIAGGVKYFWLGDADGKTSAGNNGAGTVVGNYSDNHAIAYGLKLGYRF